MKHTRKLALTLALALIMSTASACQTADAQGANTPDTSPISTDTVSDTTASLENVLEVPKGLEGGYEAVDILNAVGIMASADELNDEMDVLEQAMFERTRAVEEHFGIELTFTNVDPYGDTQNVARIAVNSGSDDHQMVFTVAKHQVNLINEGLYLPISELPYIDIEKPWWNKDYIESTSIIADDPYLLFGDISYNMLERTCCVLFNTRLLEERLNLQPSDLYELVNNGEWTIDKFTELVTQVYHDANGNAINDAGDIHGLVTYNANQIDWLAYSSGIEFTSRDENGYPKINLFNNITVDLAEKLYNLQFSGASVFNFGSNAEHCSDFANGNSVFFVNRLYVVGWGQFREMKDDYGILPMPKYSEDIEGYHSTVETLVQWGAVPVTVADPVYVSAVAEALAYYSRQLTTPAYFENTLKLKLTRDDESMAIIDMIMEGRDTDFLYINRLEKLGDVFKRLFTDGQNNFASNYASLEGAGEITLQKLIKEFEDARS